MTVVQIAITACPECGAGYSLPELRRLQLLDSYGKTAKSVNDPRDAEPVAMRFELRRCECGEPFTTRVDGLDQLDLSMPAERYGELFGDDRMVHRLPVPTWLQVWAPTLTLLALVVVAVVVAAAGIVAVVRVLL